MVFRWRLNDNKYPQVSRTLLSILSDFNNAVVWMVSPRPPISKSFSHISKPLWTVPSAAILVGINVTLIFHSSLSSSAKSKYLALFWSSLVFSLCGPLEQQSPLSGRFFFVLFCSFVLLIITRLGLLPGTKVICLNLNIPEYFMRFNLYNYRRVTIQEYLTLVPGYD